MDLISVLHPNDKGGTVYPDNAADLLQSLKIVKGRISELEDERDSIKTDITVLIGDCAFIAGGGTAASWKTQNRANGYTIRVDHKTSEEEIAGIQEVLDAHSIPYKYKEPSTNRVLRECNIDKVDK